MKIAVPELSQKGYLVNLETSDVENILTFDCFLNAFSSDHIGELRDNASAKYGASLICGDNLIASDKNLSYSDLGTTLISSSNIRNNSENSDSLSPENFFIFSLSDNSSSITNSGETNSQSEINNPSTRCFLSESGLKNENKILASTTNFIKGILNQSPCFFATLSFNSSASLDACSSVNLDFEEISPASENLTSLTNCLTILTRANSNSGFNSCGILTLITISDSVINGNSPKEYLKLSIEIKEENDELKYQIDKIKKRTEMLEGKNE